MRISDWSSDVCSSDLWRVAAVFGPVLLLGYLLRRFTLDEAMARISARLGVRVAAVKMPMAEAAIDVDKAEDLLLADEVPRKRGQAGEPGRFERKSGVSGKSGLVRVDSGGCCRLKKKK